MTIDQLIYFVSVVKNNSITKTSEELYVSQPAVSLAIKALEKELGVPLFIRNNNKLYLTEGGKHLVELAKPILEKFESIPQDMADYIATHSSIRVGIPPVIGAFMFPPVFDAFSHQYPSIQLDLKELNSQDNQKAAVLEEIDVCLTIIYKNKVNAGLDYLKIGETELFFCVRKDHPFANKKAVSIKEIGNTPILLLQPGSLQYQIVMDFYQQNNLTPNIKLCTNQLTTIQQMMQYGNVGAFLFSNIVSSLDNIVSIPFSVPVRFDVIMAWKKSKESNEMIKKFISFMQKAFQKKH